jgi:Bifunctional DNA primase/polymerase, N-terminal/AAA domain
MMTSTAFATPLQAALAYSQELGFDVFPVARGKNPLTDHGYYDASSDPEQISLWWQEHYDANVAIRCRDTGLLVVDYDVKNGMPGKQTWEALISQQEPFQTVMAQSPSGGGHIWFTVQADFAIRHGENTLGLGVDTPNYVLAPPSETEKGIYRFVPGHSPNDVQIAAAPVWLLAQFAAPANEYKAAQNGHASARSASDDEEFNMFVSYGLRQLEESRGNRDNSGYLLAVYMRDTGRLSLEDALSHQEKYWQEAVLRYPKPGEPEYTLEKALDQVERVYDESRREPAIFGRQGGPTRQRRDEPSVVGIESRRASDVTMKPLHWLWPQYIPLAKATLLEGAPDKGKSTLTLDLIARGTTGRTLPDGQVGDLAGPVDAVLMSCEDDPEDTIVPRLVVAGADLTRVHLIEHVTLSDGTKRLPSIPEDIALLQRKVEETHAKLVVIDPLVGYLTRKASANDDAEVRRALSPLHELATETGAAIVAIRHFKKDRTETDPLHRGGGSIGILAAARHALAVVADPDNPERRLLGVTKHNLSPADLAPTLAYELVGTDLTINGQRRSLSRVNWLGDDTRTVAQVLESVASGPASMDAKSRRREAYEFLERVLADGEEHPVKEVQEEAREYGISFDAVRKVNRQWTGDGRLLHQHRGIKGEPGGYWTWQLLPILDAEGGLRL